MPRGSASELGTKTINQNGYEQTKTEDGWIGTHVLMMQEHLGRKLTANERVRFRDGDRRNLSFDNLELSYLRTGNYRRQLAALDERIRELQAQRAFIQEQLDNIEAASKS